MNENLESIINAFADVAQTAMNKAKSLSSIAKSNVSIFTEQEKLKKAYAELGKLYYRDYVTGEEPDDAEYIPVCAKITDLVKRIQELRESIEDAKTKSEREVVIDDEDLEKAIAEELEDLNADLQDVEEDLAELEEERRELEEARAEIEAEIRELSGKVAAAEEASEEASSDDEVVELKFDEISTEE